MLFDKLSKYVKNISKSFVNSFLNDSKLFIIDDPELLDNLNLDEKIEDHVEFSESAYLPYETCAFEFPDDVCFILADVKKDGDFVTMRNYLAYMSKEAGRDVDVIVIGGVKHSLSDDYGYESKVNVSHVIFFQGKYEKRISGEDFTRENLGDEIIDSFINDFGYEYKRILKLLNIINHPKNFILEKTPLQKKQKRKIKSKQRKNRSLKANKRPTYTILRPNRIRQIMGLPEFKSDGRSKRGGDVRMHERFLSDKKFRWGDDGRLLDQKVIPYGNRVGERYYKKTLIPAHWRGPSKARVGNHIYRVILDR